MSIRHGYRHEDSDLARAIAVGAVGAVAIMIGPIAPWIAGVEVCGGAFFVAGAAQLVLWALRE
jgi:hypothetical protein